MVRRRAMVAAVRAGQSRRSVARSFGVSLATVQFWLARAGDGRLDRVDWSDGGVMFLGHRLHVDRHWPYRLVRAEIDLEIGRVDFYALRRREPSAQPLLAQLPYPIPDRWRR